MENISSDLYLYEIVLLFLGTFLFAILCAALVYYIIKKEDIKKLLFFFPIAILMIGYPSIQEIQIERDKIALKKYTDEVLENPEDAEARENLQEVTEKLEKRASTVKDLWAVSEANLLLGNPEKVIGLTSRAIEKAGKDTEKELSNTDESVVEEEAVVTTATSKKSDLTNLIDLRELAKVQAEIKNSPSAIQDTSRLKNQIEDVSWSNPKTKEYLTRQVVKQRMQQK